MCEGFSIEDDLALDAAMIAEYGHMVTGVDGGDGPSWTYTVGLYERVGHPELIVAGAEIVSSAKLLNQIARLVVAGRVFGAGDMWKSPSGLVRFGRVDPIQFRLGTFNVWLALIDAGHLRSNDLIALQVFAPATWFCRGHQACQPDLSRPESRVGVALTGPNPPAWHELN
jgi:uncharacterized protein DUF4262